MLVLCRKDIAVVQRFPHRPSPDKILTPAYMALQGGVLGLLRGPITIVRGAYSQDVDLEQIRVSFNNESETSPVGYE